MQRLLSRFLRKGNFTPGCESVASCESVGPREGGGGAVVDRGVWNRGHRVPRGAGPPPPLPAAPPLFLRRCCSNFRRWPRAARADVAPEALIPPPAQGTLRAPFPALWFWPPEPDVALLLPLVPPLPRCTTAAAAALSGGTAAATPRCEASGPLLVVVEQAV